jgi:putative endopeptidase
VNRNLQTWRWPAASPHASPQPPTPPQACRAGGDRTCGRHCLGVDLAIDKSAKPGDDFDAYANGAWRRNSRFRGPPNYGAFTVLLETGKGNAALIVELPPPSLRPALMPAVSPTSAAGCGRHRAARPGAAEAQLSDRCGASRADLARARRRSARRHRSV